MARSTYPPKNAPRIERDSRGDIIPFYCNVTYKGQAYQTTGYAREGYVWVKKLGSWKKDTVPSVEVTIKDPLNTQANSLKAKNTSYAQWELDKTERCIP
jgi:hypothetical protein